MLESDYSTVARTTPVPSAVIDRPHELVGIQIMRGFAAMLVVWHHALEEATYVRYLGEPPAWLIRIGAAGVDIFFVISGFIMMYTNFAPQRRCSTPVQFLRRRFLRIYPLYWVCCGLVLAMRTVGFFRSIDVAPDVVVNSLLLLPLRAKLLLSPAWTLVYEIYFYSLFAISLRARNARVSLWATFALLLFFYLVGDWSPTVELRHFLGSKIAFEFGFGLLIGYVLTRFRIPKVLRFAWIPATLFAVVATSQLTAEGTASLSSDSERLLVWGVPAAMIVLSATQWQPNLKLGWARIGLLLGEASYAVYLTHAFVMISYAALLRRFASLAEISQWPVSTVVCIAALAFGTLVHLTLERSLARLTRERLARSGGVRV